MTTSAEVRWFFKGIINNDILNFFKENQIVFQEEQPRTDWYLMNNDKFTSIKLRDGNFEVKRFVSSTENYQISPEIRGNVERWVKFSMALNDNGDSKGITQGKFPQWIQLDKKRSISKYEISFEGKISPVPSEMRPPEVCILEVCFIKTLKLDFWTLCFEASGSESTVQTNLEAVTRQIFSDSSQISLLKAENSYSYPQFLAKLSLL